MAKDIDYNLFNEVRLLDGVAYGSQFSQEFKTHIIALNNGMERRNIEWSMPLGKYTILYNNIKAEDADQIRDAHTASFGSAIGFRFKDYIDYTAENEYIGQTVAGHNMLQLCKNYRFGLHVLKRVISKPVLNTVTISINDKFITAFIDYTNGIISFNYNKAGENVYWSGEFDIPVRFENDRLDLEPTAPGNFKKKYNYTITTDVTLTEIRL